MAVIPNNDLEWPEWIEYGLACHLSTNGHVKGFAAFDMFSRKSSKYDEAYTLDRWDHFRTSPPTEIGAGTIFDKANRARPGWRHLVGLTIDQITEVLRLADLPQVQYDPVRKEVAKRFRLQVKTLDEIVAALRRRDADEPDDLQGGRIEFEPWPGAVDGGKMIADMNKAIRGYVILSEHQALAVSLWIIHTHVFDVFDHTPRLQIKSPAMRCGKSTLLRTVAKMVKKPLKTENISTAALFRVIEMHQPTMLIDEADNFLKDENDDINGIMNAGFEPGGTWTRTVGEDFEPRAFKVYAPVAFAWLVRRGIQVRQQLEDRSITVELRRRKADEQIDRFRDRHTGHLLDLARRASRWSDDHRDVLVNADPENMPEIDDRARDKWRPLIAIADAASEEWGRRARDAAVKISAETIGGEEDISLILLADVAAIFKKKIRACGGNPDTPEGQKQVPAIGSTELAAALADNDERPWGKWRRGEPLSTHSLAKMMKAYGAGPRQERINSTTKLRGYFPKEVLEAAARYVPKEIMEKAEEMGS